MKKYVITAGCTFTLALLIWLFCTPMTTEPDGEDSGPTLLRLSLEEVGRYKAEFSGAPIEAIIECDVDTFYSFLRWHSGNGQVIPADTAFENKAKRFYAKLYWTQYPIYRDTADLNYYDTVWVSMGGGLKKSNKVIVKVTNLPVVIDSAVFDSLPLLGQDTVWLCSLTQTLKESYEFTVFARDLDNKPVSLEILGNNGKIIRDGNDPLTMIYQPPEDENDFIDSVKVLAYDQMRGQAIRTLVITHMTPNIPPSIDSIKVNKSWLKGVPSYNGRYRIAFTTIDTLVLRLYAHDSLGTIKKVTWKADDRTLTADSADNRLATYICEDDACQDTLENGSESVDLITISVIDDRGDTAVREIELYKGKLNKAPRIDKLMMDGESIQFNGLTGMVNIPGGKEYLLSLKAADPEGEELAVEWSATPSSRISDPTDSSVLYHAPTARTTDTITLNLSDNELTVETNIVVVIDDILPQFNGLTVGKTVFDGTDTLYELEVSPGQVLVVIADAQDLDVEDEMSYLWTSKYPTRFTLKQDDRAQYVLPESDLNDTIILTLQDGEAQMVRYLVLVPVNQPPVVDSIFRDSVKLIGNNAVLFDSAYTGDTISYEAFAHDPESGNLAFSWTAKEEADALESSNESSRYICKDSVYIDTVTVFVEDDLGKTVTRSIQLKIDTAATQP